MNRGYATQADEAMRAAFAEVHGQDFGRTFTVAEVKQIVYPLTNVISAMGSALKDADNAVIVHHDGTLSAGRFVEYVGDRIIVDHGDSTSAVPVGSPVWFVTDVHGRVLGAEDAS
jgi:hypothetical protein